MDWLQNMPDFLKMTWPEFAKVMIGVLMVAGLAYGWVRKVRRRLDEAVKERDGFKDQKEKLTDEVRTERASIEGLLKTQQQEHEARARANLQEAGRIADERVAREKEVAQQRLDQAHVAFEREREVLRTAAERETQQLQRQAEIREEHLRQQFCKDFEQQQQAAQRAIDAERTAAQTQLRQSHVEAEQALDQSRSTFTAKVSELIQRHGEETTRLELVIADHESRLKEEVKSRLSAEHRLHESLAWNRASLERVKGLWEAAPLAEPPRFIPASDRKTRFLSISNLKGGVGKTTIAANIGVTLACRGHRVLLVDLDFQGSLSQVSLEGKALRLAISRHDTARSLFEHTAEKAAELLERVIQPVAHLPPNAATCDVIPAWNDLADVETEEFARWILDPEREIRFRLRELFHKHEFCERYDYVIFDCPPRLTTASVNAFAASDGVIIPIMLDWQSASPIAFMFPQFRRLLPILAGTRMLGIVANQAKFHNGKLVQQMQSVWNQVCTRLDVEGLRAEDAFRVMVKSDPAIAAEVNNYRIPAVRAALRPIFDGLVDSIERAKYHESLQPV